MGSWPRRCYGNSQWTSPNPVPWPHLCRTKGPEHGTELTQGMDLGHHPLASPDPTQDPHFSKKRCPWACKTLSWSDREVWGWRGMKRHGPYCSKHTCHYNFILTGGNLTAPKRVRQVVYHPRTLCKIWLLWDWVNGATLDREEGAEEWGRKLSRAEGFPRRLLSCGMLAAEQIWCLAHKCLAWYAPASEQTKSGSCVRVSGGGPMKGGGKARWQRTPGGDESVRCPWVLVRIAAIARVTHQELLCFSLSLPAPARSPRLTHWI